MRKDPPAGPAHFCDVAGDRDEPDLRRLHAQPMPGAIALSLHVGPDSRHAAAIQGDYCDTVVIRRRGDGRAVAAGSRSARDVWINGQVQRVGYLGGLRSTPGLRLPRRLIVEAFDRLRSMRRPGEVDFDLTSIMSDNRVARRALERGVKGMPRYTPIGEVDTLSLRAKRRSPPAWSTRRLTGDDLPLIETLLEQDAKRSNCRPRWSAAVLRCPERCRGLTPDHFVGYESAGELIACAAAWDQRAFKQTVVSDLSPSLKRWRRAINLGCRVTGRITLPRPRTELSMVYLSHLVFPRAEPGILRQLIDEIRSLGAELGAAAIVLGLPVRSERDRSRTMFRSAWRTRSMIYAVHGEASPPPPFDELPIWPEVAVL